ncbi:MAG: Uncharacterized protein YuzE [Chloroflexi bacterium]|jgi:uncharacterized protein YuzE|nr:MAG: Uncharacterized protein YuzE [Chloroflexota bacterium]
MATQTKKQTKTRYFDDTDTLWIGTLRPAASARDIDEDVIVSCDEAGEPVSITIEHASRLLGSFVNALANSNIR